jgi:hypothetical protein
MRSDTQVNSRLARQQEEPNALTRVARIKGLPINVHHATNLKTILTGSSVPTFHWKRSIETINRRLLFFASDRDYANTFLSTMASSGTMRGTPSRGQGRGQMPAFNNSPASNIPRPAMETHASQSEAGGSTMSASRQKQTKRDEVGLAVQ